MQRLHITHRVWIEAQQFIQEDRDLADPQNFLDLVLSKPQPNLNSTCLTYVWVLRKNDFTPPPTENSMSAIFQLLMARF